MSLPHALSTDFYELTMMAGYHAAGLTAPATFELYVRDLPPHRNYLVAAGLDQALHYLETLRFAAEDIAYLRELPVFAGVDRSFFDDFLPRFRFTGDVWAMEEGTPVFPPAPLLRVTAPLPEAQFVETAVLSIVAFQTSVASRAARMVEAAAGRAIVEFGARRAHGLEAGVLAGRAAVVAGCEATSNTEAGRRFGVPVSGTMAHSWVTAFPDERAAFQAYYDLYGERTVVLLDTYDPIAAASIVADSTMSPRAVRIDSGDIVPLSREVRSILDRGGKSHVGIFVSGDMDEWRICDIVDAGAPVDGFGVGSALSTSSDVPSLGAVYKLVEIERGGVGVPIMKLSTGKQTLPGVKQVWRAFDAAGQAAGDVISLTDDFASPGSRSLMRRVMHHGVRAEPSPGVVELRARSLAARATLPPPVRRLRQQEPYPVQLSPRLQQLRERLTRTDRLV